MINALFPHAVPPRIHHVSHLAPFEVLQGATVKMECRASGNPVPAIAWTRKNGALPSGERTVSGMSLVIQHADRHASGVYQCAADNGVGQPDIKQISLTVLCKNLLFAFYSAIFSIILYLYVWESVCVVYSCTGNRSGTWLCSFGNRNWGAVGLQRIRRAGSQCYLVQGLHPAGHHWASCFAHPRQPILLHHSQRHVRGFWQLQVRWASRVLADNFSSGSRVSRS